MKQQDIAIIIVIVFLSGVFSYFLSNQFISPPKRDLTAAKVEPITPEFNEPSNKYFNENSINPTQLIRIGSNKNQNPLNGQQ
jgi:hypothetical protein